MRTLSIILTVLFVILTFWHNSQATSVTQNYKYVEIQLTTQDSNSSNRGYKAVNTSLMAIIGCNSQLAAYGAGGDTNSFTQAPTAAPTATPTPTATATPTPSSSSTPTPTPAPTATPTPVSTATPTPTPVAANHWWNWWGNSGGWGF